MARIKLIVTGDMEKLALTESLKGIFPSQRRDGEDVTWDSPRKMNCTTSHRLQAHQGPSRPMLALATAMLAEVGTGKKGQPADLVVAIDDLEIGNFDREHIVVDHVRRAVESLLEEHSGNTQNRYRALLRERCSFHLFRPMVESYLFGDPAAIERCGVPANTQPILVHPTDVEQFETVDPGWLPTCHAENQKRRLSVDWWRHELHPKAYLEHLAQCGEVLYDEVRQGREALAALRWREVPKRSSDTPLARSLFEDLADWFQVSNPLGGGNTNTHLYPGRSVRRDRLLLRNL